MDFYLRMCGHLPYTLTTWPAIWAATLAKPPKSHLNAWEFLQIAVWHIKNDLCRGSECKKKGKEENHGWYFTTDFDLNANLNVNKLRLHQGVRKQAYEIYINYDSNVWKILKQLLNNLVFMSKVHMTMQKKPQIAAEWARVGSEQYLYRIYHTKRFKKVLNQSDSCTEYIFSYLYIHI